MEAVWEGFCSEEVYESEEAVTTYFLILVHKRHARFRRPAFCGMLRVLLHKERYEKLSCITHPTH